jgi:Glyoxalase-like domain
MNALRTELDHIVVAAKTLDEGRAWARKTLGVEAVGGGKHEGLATHNTLLKLNGRCYLEIIAIDPEAGEPNFPRWFGLDTAEVQELVAHGPRLVAWVARVSGADDDIEQLAASPDYSAKIVRPATRADFRWRFAFTPDGARIGNGTMPHLVQWDSPVHPCERLPESGLALTSLMLGAPEPERLTDMLAALHFADPQVQVGQSTATHLVAMLRTPLGSVVLD